MVTLQTGTPGTAAAGAIMLIHHDDLVTHQILEKFLEIGWAPRVVFSPAPRMILHLCVMADGNMWVVGVKTARLTSHRGNEVTMTRLWKSNLR